MEGHLILRLLLAGIFGAIIGFERKSKRKEAGLRTHFLVAVGSALIMIISKYAFNDILSEQGIALDPSRIAAQVVSGIGFLGVGTIIIQRHSVRGLTTAAGLWTTSGIGLAVGAGMYLLGLVATILVLLGLEVLTKFLQIFLPKYVQMAVDLSDKAVIGQIISALSEREIEVSLCESKIPLKEHGDVQLVLKLNALVPRGYDTNKLLEEVQLMAGVCAVRFI
ncbi:MgtC/SapB family protein [Propionispora vibrioides]|jgi:putative Mg2+ transporter-C (MgtC) family protein|uniref:Putative Mg2+ transporter-C (MgtC) family protein n=1 Tax=Propionispora vibrioides TaxID=112903 RepID=A0A1H8VPF1_9FIRM|nr:MgtC/SapB family protein [Propionispora vibrioides]SEP17312.1 putative Mg2+ transporter-C (MgtC) family protein [Propionispora vibrioides]